MRHADQGMAVDLGRGFRVVDAVRGAVE